MNNSTRVMRRPRRAWPPATRIAAAVIATAALAPLAAACGGSPSSTGVTPNAGGSATSTSAVAYSHCIRSHGVPNYPDPSSGGRLPKGNAEQFGVSNSRLQTARRACQHMYPSNGGSFQQLMLCENTGDCPQAVVQHALTEMRSFAQCMRSHGVPNWPDPTIDSQGRPFFNVSGAGLSHAYTHSPLIESKDRECGRQVGGSAGVPVPMG
jgi:hypothetical protein